MDYIQWGAQYLDEAETLKARAAVLQQKLKGASGEEAVSLFRRIAILRSMYLENLHIGRCLQERGRNSETMREAKPRAV